MFDTPPARRTRRTFDAQWRASMRDLLVQMESELPLIEEEDPAEAAANAILHPPGPQGGADGAKEEKPEPPVDSRGLREFTAAHVEYLRIFQNLELVYDQMCHPQKREAVKMALEACAGRVLETRHWMVKLNDGVEALALDDILADLKKCPDAIEIPVPRCFVGDRAASIEAREAFLRKEILKKAENDDADDERGGGDGASDADAAATNGAPPEDSEAVAKTNARRAEIEALQAFRFMKAPGMPEEEALRLIQRNERGRQGRARSAGMAATRREQALADAALLNKRSEAEVAVICQALIRGFLTRRRVRRARDEEFAFLGMKAPARLERRTLAEEAEEEALLSSSIPSSSIPRDSVKNAVALRDANNAERRRALRDERAMEIERATVELRKTVKATEGREMREKVQDAINAWFVENRDPITGEYPEFPGEDKGGSRDILDPPPPKPPPPPPEDPKAKAAREKKEAEAKKKAEAEAKKKAEEAKKKGVVEAKPEKIVTAPVAFVREIRDALERYHAEWGDTHDLATNFEQRHDAEKIADKLRPAVFEEVRVETDAEMREVLAHLREMVAAERGAGAGAGGKKGKAGGKGGGKKGGGGGGKKKGGGGKKGKGKKDPTADRTLESLYAELCRCGVATPLDAGAFGGARTPRDDGRSPSADHEEAPSSAEDGASKSHDSNEALAAADSKTVDSKEETTTSKEETTTSNGKDGDGGSKFGKEKESSVSSSSVPASSPFALASAFVGIPETASARAEQRATGSGVFPLPTLAHARQSVAAHVALPLGLSSAAKAKLPRHVKSVLLYGAAGTGKSRLTTEAARAAGAAVFDLSPRVIDGLYPGAKGVASLLQMTFKVAKLCAPSVIVMDDAEAVFLTDKKKTKELLESGAHRDKTLCLDAPSRVKKELVKEMKALKKTDRVVLVGHARAPYACLKKDRKALLSFFDARVLTPTPDRATRAALFRETTRALGGGELARGFQLAELVAASGDYGAGAIERAVANALRPRVLAKLKNDLDLDGNISEHALDADAFLKWLALESPVSKTEQGELRDWTRSLPEYAALKKRRDPPPPPDEPLESDAKGKKKGK